MQKEAWSLIVYKSGCRLMLPAAYHCLFTVSPPRDPQQQKDSLYLPPSPLPSPLLTSSATVSLHSVTLSLSLSRLLIPPHASKYAGTSTRAKNASKSKAMRTRTHKRTNTVPPPSSPSPRPRSVLCLEAMSDSVCCLSVALKPESA